MNEQLIERIPIEEIHIANPRPRNRARWQMIVANIREVGLKKPITVVRCDEASNEGNCTTSYVGRGASKLFSLWAKVRFLRSSPVLPAKISS